MVGDNLLADIQGAQMAGINSVWIDAHRSGPDAEDDITPDRVVASLGRTAALSRQVAMWLSSTLATSSWPLR